MRWGVLIVAHQAAAIDRLVHHCIILELNIPSNRMEQAKKNREAIHSDELSCRFPDRLQTTKGWRCGSSGLAIVAPRSSEGRVFDENDTRNGEN